MPELTYSERLTMIGEEYICWKDIIILGDDIYRLDHGVYKKTEESPDDFFGIEVSHSYEVKQYNNLIITVDEAEDEFIIYDLDSMDKYNYEIYNKGSIAGYWWYVCNGRIYYEVQEKDNSLDRTIMRMDLFTGESEKIYSLSESELADGMILGYVFMIRKDETIITAVYNENTEMVEYRRIKIDSDQATEEKLWETNKYVYAYFEQYNEQGAFIFGEFYRPEGGKETEIICLNDQGDARQVEILSIYGLIITDKGYFLCDNSKNPYEIVDNMRDRKSLTRIVDSITFYNFEGESIERYYLDNEEFAENDYELENIIYTGEKMIVIYSGNDDLQIVNVPISN